ncbi:MAG TPA: hypothetical protein VGL14_02575 [Methylomirabilota bacterium]|jgi:hypothetical protein
MAELVREYPMLVGGMDDTAFVAQVWGRQMSDGRWEAWIVFTPVAGGHTRRTDRETVQATRAAVEYWASGVTSIYLQGALNRSRPVRISAA